MAARDRPARASAREPRPARLDELGERLVATQPRADAAGAAAHACLVAAINLHHAGRRELGDALLERAELLGRPFAEGERTLAGLFEYARGYRALHVGDPAGCVDACSRAIALYDEGGDRRTACSLRVGAAFALVELGAYDRARASLEAVLVAARRTGLRALEALALQNLSAALSRGGRLAEACEAARQALALCAAQGFRRVEGGSRLYLAEALLAAGDLEEARREALAACSILEEASPPLHPNALAIPAEVELARGDLPAALAAAREVRARLDRAGVVEEGEGLVRLADAEALAAAGEDEAAREALREAHARLLERAERISDPEMRRSFLENVHEHARTIERSRASH